MTAAPTWLRPLAARRLACLSAALLAAVCLRAAAADDTMDPKMHERARVSAERGLEFLRGRMAADGSWSKSVGVTALALRAILASPHHYSEQDEVISKPIEFLLAHRRADGSITESDVNQGYNTALTVSALIATRNAKYQPVIEAGTAYLKKIQIDEAKGYKKSHAWYGGIGYSDDGTPDMSNQYLALTALRDAAVDPKDPVWQKALKFISRSQNRSESNDQKWASNDGGFIYMPGANLPPFKGTESYGTMTSAGLITLLYAGVDKKDPRIQDAYKWIRNHYTLETVPGTDRKDGLYYFYLAFAQCLFAYGTPTLTDGNGVRHVWRNELGSKLVGLQLQDGSWVNKDSALWWQDNPELVTAFTVNALDYVLQ
jgi:squalene-hopene/tetraprenyl-beta-curcumene cyclase